MRRLKHLLNKNDRVSESPRPRIPDSVSIPRLPPISGIPEISTAAAQEVLSTSELLNLIFSYLSQSTLGLSVKRVCRVWYSILRNPSPTLQVSLFLRPAPETCALFPTPTTNDILTQSPPFWLLSTLKLPKPGACSCSPNKCGPWTTAASASLLPWKLHPIAWQRNASLRKKWLLIQPPCKKLHFWKQTTFFKTDERSRVCRTRFAVDCPDGVTLGSLYDVVEGWIREAKNERYTSEYKELLTDNRTGENFDSERDRGRWVRKELYLCDNLEERYHMLFLHLDLDRYSLALV